MYYSWLGLWLGLRRNNFEEFINNDVQQGHSAVGIFTCLHFYFALCMVDREQAVCASGANCSRGSDSRVRFATKFGISIN